MLFASLRKENNSKLCVALNNCWKQLNDMVDFTFVYEELRNKYSSTMGRTCEDVIRMFKYLLLNLLYLH